MYMGASKHPEASCAGLFYHSWWESDRKCVILCSTVPQQNACTTRTAGCSVIRALICAVGAWPHMVQGEIDPKRARSTASFTMSLMIDHVLQEKVKSGSWSGFLCSAWLAQVTVQYSSCFYANHMFLFRFSLCKPSSNLIKECSPWVHAWSMLNGSERELAWLCCVDRHLGQRRQLRDAAEWKKYQRTSNSSLSPNASSFSCLRLPRYTACL